MLESLGDASNAATGKTAPSNSKIVGNYEVLNTIGEGSFAKVKLAFHRMTRIKVLNDSHRSL